MLKETGIERRDKRKVVGKAGAVFIAVMLLLTFMSNTINNYLSPRVRYENPEGGQLTREISGSGYVRARKTAERYVEGNRKVLKVTVKVGDTVKIGQQLMELDIRSMEDQLENEIAVMAQKKLMLEKLKIGKSGGDLKKLENNVETARMNVDKARKNYEDIQALYDIGAEAQVNVEAARTDYEKAQLEFENAKLNTQTAEEQQELEKAANEMDLKSALNELALQEKKVDRLKKEIGDGTVYAPESGTVIELNFPEGTTADGTKPLFRIAQTAEGFQFCATVSAEATKLLSAGDQGEVSIDSHSGYPVEGTVCEINDNPQERGVKKDIILDIPPENLIGGENGTMTVKKDSKEYDMLVANSAVGQDVSGYFVYIVKEQNGPLGNSYVVQKVKISAGESDDSRTVVLSGLNSLDRVVTGSDKPLSDGMKVLPVTELQ